MDESRLIAAAQQGDLAAFNQLVLHYQNFVYNVAYRILGDSDLAADAAQDAFIKAYKAIGHFRGHGFKSWLARIVTNTCYDYLRSRKRRASESLEGMVERGEPPPRLQDTGEGPQAYAERQELNQWLQWALQQLTEDHRVIITLIDIQGFSYEEAAHILGVSTGTVKSRLSRARARLRALLQENPELLPVRYRSYTRSPVPKIK